MIHMAHKQLVTFIGAGQLQDACSGQTLLFMVQEFLDGGVLTSRFGTAAPNVLLCLSIVVHLKP